MILVCSPREPHLYHYGSEMSKKTAGCSVPPYWVTIRFDFRAAAPGIPDRRGGIRPVFRVLQHPRVPFRVRDFYPDLARELGRGRMLDLGCGDGNAMKPFFDAGWECVGVDVDARALERASRYGRVVLRKGEDPLTSISDASFDLVSANAVLHHLGDVEANLLELRRCLKPGGLLLVNEVVEDSAFMRAGRTVFRRWRGMPIRSRFAVRDWLPIFDRHRLELLAAYGQNHWASLAFMLAERVPGGGRLGLRFERFRFDPTDGRRRPIMFVLFVLRKKG
jgi:SAM-dependent methyltransferase